MHTYIDLHTYHHPASRRFSPAPTTPAPTTPHHTAPHRTHRLSAHARVAPPASDHRCDLRAPTIDGADDHRRRRRPRIPLPLDAGRERPPTYTPGPPAVAAAPRASWPRAPSPGGSRQHHRPPPRPPDACDAMAHNATTTTTNPPKHTMSTTGSTHAGKYFCAACARRA
jgi:hypothetical protein